MRRDLWFEDFTPGQRFRTAGCTLSEAQIRNLKNAYRVLYRSDLKLADAVAELKNRAATQPELRILVDFIGESTRSLVR